MASQVIRTYSELITIPSFLKRFEYLKLGGVVGQDTFGFDRYLNQQFYRSDEWKRIRNHVIARDMACDLGMDGFEIHGRIYVHHMNPIASSDIIHSTENLMDPEFLICTTHDTHNAIHYGNEDLLQTGPIERRPNDTCPWKR